MLGVCYYPEHWPEAWWARDAARMVEMGISFVRIGEFAWSRLEPSRGQYDFGWLDRAMDTLHAAGLRIVLGTPTATPPKWLMDEHPDIAPYDEQGRVKGFGSRRHYSFSSKTYWRESARIVELLAKRYGQHPGVEGWQTDNEYGCHFTVLSWGAEDLKGFKEWLRLKYQSPVQLNEAWGNVFWSMEVQSFDEIALPHLTVTETNPAARLDFWRYQSDQVAAYDKMQCDILRKHSPGRFITHNFMGFFNEFNHWDVGANLDVASWDSYPIGFTETFLNDEAEKIKWATTAHPDIAPFHHDLYRAVGKGRLWVMEQQPGPVNWAAWNPIPKPGMVRLWTWEAMAHGAEVVSYFRWRQAQSAQEQMHAGLNLPGQHELSAGGREAMQVGAELRELPMTDAMQQSPVAIVYDYEAAWVTAIQPQGADYKFHELMFKWYSAVRARGLDVDFVAPGADLAGYALVLVPSLPHINDRAAAALAAAKGVVLYGPRVGSKTRHFAIPDNLPPGPLGDQLKMRVLEVSSLRPGLKVKVTGKVKGSASHWVEYIETASTIEARFSDGHPALIANGQQHYLACWPDQDLLQSVIDLMIKRADLKSVVLPEGVRLRRRGNKMFAMNYSDVPWKAPFKGKPILGKQTVAPQSVSCWVVRN